MITELWSHPGKPLLVHSREVALVATENIKGKSFCFTLDFNGQSIAISKILPDLIYISAAFHDLGKATSFFQQYIRNPEARHDKRKSHALLSAVFVFFAAEKYLQSRTYENEFGRFFSVFAFSAVKRHHGRLNNISDEILIDPEWRELLPELAKSIDCTLVQPFIDELLKGLDFNVDWTEFLQFISDEVYDKILEDFSFDVLQNSMFKLTEISKLSLYYFHHVIYSSLLFADKNEVILTGKHEAMRADIEQKINKFRDQNGFNSPKSEINRLKNESLFSSLQNLEKVFQKDQHIYSLTLPTGLGKTITAYMLADKLRKLAGADQSRIIVNIPFTSIIDQNFEVFAKILQTEDSSLLLKHHHLADPIYKSGETMEDYYQSKFLIETWQSDTIVTTFVQLLETILSCDKSKLMKFSQMANSVILLDEIQTIPYALWETIREVFKTLGRSMKMYFILISATQPLIFNPEDDILEIVPDYMKYFRIFNRTRLIIESPVSFELFLENLSDYLEQQPQKDVLCILNTKRAALNAFENIGERVVLDQTELFFLSTLITPFERKDIINRIKTPSEKRKVIISTQLVEAGVDISVDTVFRQLAPLDSIIQAAGRANRYNEKDSISEVFVFDIEDYRKATNLVYGSDLMIKTSNVLKDYKTLEEKDYLELIQKYFAEVRKQSDNTSQPVLKAMKGLDFGNVDFELIESRKTESVYLQLNERAREVWENYVKIYSTPDLKSWERDELFSKIKSEFYDFVINVPVPFGSDRIVFDTEKEFNFYLSRIDYPSQNYRYSEGGYAHNTGYVGESNTLQFL